MEKLVNIKLNKAEDGIIIIDQREIPLDVVYLEIKTKEQSFDAIETLAVRGAPAIGIFAGYSMYVLAKPILASNKDKATREAKLRELADYLNSSRPTAVNLHYVLERMMGESKGGWMDG